QIRAQHADAGEMHARGGVVDDVARKRLPEETARRVLEIHPLEVALPVEHREGTYRTERGAADMSHDGVRDVAAPVTAQPRAVRQVDVLVRRKEVFIEAAELLEDRFRHHAGRTADPEHFFAGR